VWSNGLSTNLFYEPNLELPEADVVLADLSSVVLVVVVVEDEKLPVYLSCVVVVVVMVVNT